MSHRDDDDRQREADAILRRLRQETDPQIGAGTAQMVTNAKAHFSGADADPNDRIEVLGTRIGRLAGLAACIVLAIMFVVNYLLP
jgi:hypothetical protein